MINLLQQQSEPLSLLHFGKWISESKIVTDTSDSENAEEEDLVDTIQIASCNNNEDSPIIYEHAMIVEYKKQESLHRFKNNALPGFNKNYTENDRDILTNWILFTSISLSLTHYTVAVASKIFDYLIESFPLDRNELKIYAATAIFIASKLEEEDTNDICDQLSSAIGDPAKTLIVKTELKILRFLNWNVNFITPFMYIEHFIAHKTSKNSHDLILKLKQLSKAITYSFMLNHASMQFTSFEIACNIFELCLYYTHETHIQPDNECIRHILKSLTIAFDENGALRSKFPYLVSIFI